MIDIIDFVKSFKMTHIELKSIKNWLKCESPITPQINFWIFFGKLVKFGKFPTDKNYNKWIWQWCPLSWCWPVCGKMNHKHASEYVLGLNLWFPRPEWTLNEETLREILKLVTSVNLPVKILLPVEHPFPNYRFTTELNRPLATSMRTYCRPPDPYSSKN